MAKKPKSFRLDEAKKQIIIFDNVVASPAEVDLKNYYLSNGYKPMTETKKAGITVAEMRKALKKDPEALAKFNELYKTKEKVKNPETGKEEVGFHRACKFFTEWKKAQEK